MLQLVNSQREEEVKGADAYSSLRTLVRATTVSIRIPIVCGSVDGCDFAHI